MFKDHVEVESTAPLSTRRIKRSPLRDVAAMIRSFHYAAHTALLGQHSKGAIAASDMTRAGLWADYWQLWVSSSFLRSYLKAAAGEAFLPREPDELENLLSVFMLEKALLELEYELTYRPEWVGLPLAGILRVLG